MATSTESAALLEEIDEEEEDEFDVIIRQAQAEEQAKIEARSKKNNLYLDVPPLTSDKTHHLFVSHSNEPEEAEWTEQLINSLEIDYGLKCLWPKRDFKPGQQVGDQIQKGILGAEKVVLVLSPESNESNWCRYERDFAFHLSVSSEENRIIPVLFRQCDVPHLLKTLNYIDVTAGEDPSFRIRRSFDEDTQCLKSLIPGIKSVKEGARPENGKSVTISAAKNLRFICRGPAWSFRELDTHTRYALRKLGSKYSEKVYFDACNIANDSAMLKYYSLTNSCAHGCTVCFSLFVLITFILLFLFSFIQLLEQRTINGFLIFVFPAIGIAMPLFMCGCDRMNMSRLKLRLTDFSLENVWKTKILVNIFARLGTPPRLVILYYDVNPCLEYLTNIISKEDKGIEENEGLARLKARTYLSRLLRDKYQLLFTNGIGIPQTVVNRHSTFLGKACLCEIAQAQLWKTHIV